MGAEVGSYRNFVGGRWRLMFAADHPFGEMADTGEWFDSLDIGAADRAKISRTNAELLLDLSPRRFGSDPGGSVALRHRYGDAATI